MKLKEFDIFEGVVINEQDKEEINKLSDELYKKEEQKIWFEDERTYYVQTMPRGLMKKLVEIAEKVKQMNKNKRKKYLNEVILAYKTTESNEIKFRSLNSFEKKKILEYCE